MIVRLPPPLPPPALNTCILDKSQDMHQKCALVTGKFNGPGIKNKLMYHIIVQVGIFKRNLQIKYLPCLAASSEIAILG